MKTFHIQSLATAFMVAFLCSCTNTGEQVSTDELRYQDSVRQAYVADSLARVAAHEAYLRSVPGAQDSISAQIKALLSGVVVSSKKSLSDFFSQPLVSTDAAMHEEQSFRADNDLFIDAHLLWMLRSFPHSQDPDSIVFRPKSSELYSYRQVFDNGVVFKMIDYESGLGFECFIPSKNRTLLKSFYEQLFQDEMNTWINDSIYGPEDGEAGCYVNLYTRPQGTLVTKYCGC